MMYTQSRRYRTKMQEGGQTQALVGEVEDRLKGTVPEGGTYTAEKLADADLTDTEISYDKLGDTPTVTAEKASMPTDVVAPSAPEEGAYSYTAATTTDKITDAEAAQLAREDISREVTIDAPQGTCRKKLKRLRHRQR